ncbi:MAG: hypothetical protein JRI75_12600, partial [Deltaproteobacteria bacterium]|nr:hypothetical protein [Deltaproteobacteria bacterium]
LVRYLVQVYAVLKGDGPLNEFTKQSDLSEIASTTAKAYVDMVRKLPAMVTKRREFRKMHRVRDTKMLRLIWKYHLPVREIIGMENR